MYVNQSYISIFVLFVFCFLHCKCSKDPAPAATCMTDNLHQDEYNEELFIHDLKNGRVLFNYVFEINEFLHLISETSHTNSKHFSLFPRSISEIVTKYGVSEFHFSLSQGYWDYDSWGYPPQSMPLGAELWAWFLSINQNIDKNWHDFVHTLSGMFCASLTFMSKKGRYTSPKWAYKPQGVSWKDSDPRQIRMSQIMHQGVCTENETPWFKLLPCKKQAGIGQLLNSLKIHDAAYHSLQVHFVPTPHGHVLKLSFSTVLDKRVLNYGENNWSIFKLLKRVVSTDCSLAKSSKIFVQTAGEFTLRPQPKIIHKMYHNLVNIAEYNLHDILKPKQDSLDISFLYNEKWVTYSNAQPPFITVHKHLTGSGSELGGVSVVIANHHPSADITVGYLDVIPWYFRFMLHSLKISIRGLKREALKKLYEPAIDREKPARLELILQIPANAAVTVQYSFIKALLRWDEYLPDANHGLYIPPTVISFNQIVNQTNFVSVNQMPLLTSTSVSLTDFLSLAEKPDFAFVRMYSEPLLVSVPTPDFSMPYNVLCLVCTVLAIGAGFLHNITCKVLSVTDPRKPTGLKGILYKIKHMFGKSEKPAVINNSNDTDSDTKEQSTPDTPETAS